ncbi:MAG: ribosome-associated translation inhibitor RaiA [Planctomycetes bacterium]|nr:ribosome-associated translation inhibitor RaiA [Planctomycetota bacterium]
MKVTITGRNTNVHDTIRTYAAEKAGKLDRYFDQLREVEIVFSSEGDRKTVEMIAHPRKGERIVGQMTHEDPFAAVDLLVDKMYNQLHKAKEKLKDRRKRSGRVPPPLAPDEMAQPAEELESYDEVVEEYSERFDAP